MNDALEHLSETEVDASAAGAVHEHTDADAHNGAATRSNDWSVACLTIGDCGPLYEKIRESLDRGEKVHLNLSVCQEIDTAGLQLLTAINSDPEVSLKVDWNRPSQTVIDRAANVGLSSWIEAGVREVTA